MDPEVRKKVLRLITYGLYVVTAKSCEEIAASTVNWLSQASFEPPLIMVALKKDGKLHAVVESARSFAVNVLGADQKEVAQAFFKPATVEGDKINGHRYEPGPSTGAPLLVDLPAWFEAKVVDSVKRGDHTIFVAEVVNVGLRRPDARPLEMWDTGWFYGG